MRREALKKWRLSGHDPRAAVVVECGAKRSPARDASHRGLLVAGVGRRDWPIDRIPVLGLASVCGTPRIPPARFQHRGMQSRAIMLLGELESMDLQRRAS